MPRLDYLWYEIDAQTKGFDEGILKSGQKLENFVAYAKGAPMVILGALAAAAVVAGAKIAQMGQDFEYAMARVNTAAQVPKAALDTLGAGVLQISRDTGAALGDLTHGLYDIVSSGIPASEALKVLEVAARGAVGGVTNVAVVVDGLTSILNAYRDENLDAAKVQDQMFEAVNKGKITYEELAGSIGQVVGIAATMHIKLDDLLGVITQLSLQGIHASEAITGVRAAIENIIKPNQQFSQLFPQIAAQFTEGRLRGEGFTAFLLDLEKAARGNTQVFAQLFSSVEAYKTVLAALQHEGRDTAAMFRDIQTATGAADDAFQKMNETTAQTEQRLKAGVTASLTELGERLLPVKNAILAFELELAKMVTNATPNDYLKPIEDLAAQLKGGALDGQAVRRLTSEVAILSQEFQSGTIDLHRYTSDELKALDTALTTIEAKYKDLGGQLGPFHEALKALLVDQARAAAFANAPSEAAKRQGLFNQTQQDVTLGQQSAHDALTPPDQALAYKRALAQVQAITQAIDEAQKKLDKARDESKLAIAAGAAGDQQLAEAQRNAESARATINDLTPTLKQAQEVVRQGNVRTEQLVNGLTNSINEMLAKSTKGAADDLIAQLAKLDNEVDTVRKKAKTEGGIDPIDQAAVDRVHAVYVDLISVARQADATKRVLEQTGHQDGTRGTPEDFEALDTRQAILEADLEGTTNAERRRDLENLINEIIKRRTELTDKILESNKLITDYFARQRNEQSKLIQDQATAVDTLIKAGVSLAESFHVVDDRLGSILSSLSSVSTGIKPFLDALDKFDSLQKDSHGNPLETFGGVVAAAGPIIGGLTTILSTLFSGSSNPEAERQRQVVEDNTAAIARLTGVMAHFNDVQVTGDQATKAEAAVQGTFTALNAPGLSSGIVAELDKQLKAQGLTRQDLEDIAKKYGVTIDFSNAETLRKSLEQLYKAIETAPITYLDNYTDGLSRLNAQFAIMGTGPIDQLIQLGQFLAKESPAFKKALDGKDLTTDAGRQAAIAALQQEYQDFINGKLTHADFGGLTPEQFVEEMQDLIKRLQSGDSSVAGSGGYNISHEVTEQSAGALIAQATTANVWLQQIAKSTAAIAAALLGTAAGTLPVVTPPTNSVTASGSAGAFVLDFSGMSINIQPGASIDDARAAGQQLGTALGQAALDAINKGLNADLLRKKRLNGSTSIRSLS